MKSLNQYELYEFLFTYYNKKLFNGKLSLSFISISQKRGFVSFFLPENEDEEDLSQNKKWKSIELHIAFVHEMLHVYQQKYGKPSRNGYHNREYGQFSEQRGLLVSSTGKNGGKKSGQKINQVPDAMFLKAYNEIPFENLIFRPIPVIDEWSEYHGCVNTHMIERMRKRRVLPFIENTQNNKRQIRKQSQCPSCGKNLRDIKDMEVLCLVCLKAYDEDEYNRIIGKYKEFVFREEIYEN